eukprot:scaffold34649_cov22-Tisochrysis_lutea.AAC.2
MTLDHWEELDISSEGARLGRRVFRPKGYKPFYPMADWSKVRADMYPLDPCIPWNTGDWLRCVHVAGALQAVGKLIILLWEHCHRSTWYLTRASTGGAQIKSVTAIKGPVRAHDV